VTRRTPHEARRTPHEARRTPHEARRTSHEARRTSHVARKRFGQHFLEPAWVEKAIRAIDPRPDQTFLEIGPGRGALTRPLAARAKQVIAFEIDRGLASALEAEHLPNVRIVAGDFLRRTSEFVLPTSAFRVAGNLPYNISSPILFELLGWHASGLPIADATLMLQREVADRLVALPGTREYGVLTVLTAYRARVERVLALAPGAFRPPPRVHSAVVRLTFHPPATPARDEAAFTYLVRAVFTHRRKTLANALPKKGQTPYPAAAAVLARAGLDGRRRPETLTVAELVGLADLFSST